MRFRLTFAALALLAALLAFPLTSHADPNSVGNGSSPCQYFPNLSVGNGADQCTTYEAIYNTPFPVPTTPSTNSVNNNIPGSRTTPIMFADPSKSLVGIACVPGLITTVQHPFCETWNMQTGAIGTLTAIETTVGSGTSATLHNYPGGGWLAGGTKFIVLANAQTNSESNNCLTVGGLAGGTTVKCQEAWIGNATSGGVAFTDLSAAGSFIHLPMVGTSEISCFGWGGTVTALPSGYQPFTMCGGQSQFNSSWNNLASGTFTYITLHPTYTDLTGQTFGHVWVDTMNGAGGIAQNEDALTTAVGSYNSGEQEITASQHDDVVVLFKVTASAAGTGGVSITLPAAGTFAGGTCTDSKTVSGTITTDVAGFVADFNSGSFSGTGCSTVQNTYTAQVVQNAASLGDCAVANQCFYIVLNSGNPTGLPTSPSGSGTGTITATVVNEKTPTSGSLHNPFEWATIRSVGDGSVLVALVNMLGTGSASDVGTHQSYGMNASIWWSAGPVNGVWTWCDVTRCADGYSVTSSPATTVPFSMGGGNGTTCTGFPNCTNFPTVFTDLTNTTVCKACIVNATAGNRPATMAPFTYDYQNASRHSAVGTQWAILDRLDMGYNAKDGDLDLVYSCGDSTANDLFLCFARISATTGLTVSQSYIENGFTDASHPYTDVSLIEKNDGTMVVYASNGGQSTPGSTGGAYTAKYVSADNVGATGTWTRSVAYSSAGTAGNGAVWISVSDPYGLHVTKGTIGPSVTSNTACSGGCTLTLMDFRP